MLVQIDTLHERSQPSHHCRHFSAIDPITRYAHAHLSHQASSSAAASFLRDCLERWPHPISSIQVDNGSEFMGAFERVCSERGVELVTIPPATPKPNAHVERLQPTFRDEHYAFEPPALALTEANTHLASYLHSYNHHRPHHALHLQTPIEYAQGWNPPTSQTT